LLVVEVTGPSVLTVTSRNRQPSAVDS